MGDGESELERVGCVSFAEGGAMRVIIKQKVLKAFKDFPRQHAAKLHSNAELMCEGKPLTEKQHNGNEGRSPGGLRLEALKAYQWRLYGYETTLGSVRTFVIVDYDQKKTERANPNVLARSYTRIDEFEREYCGGK